MLLNKIDRADIPKVLDEIEKYNENPRYNRAQFEKYLECKFYNDDNSFFASFDGGSGQVKALAFVSTTEHDATFFNDTLFIAEIQSFVRRSGRILLEGIVELANLMNFNIWLMKSTEADEGLERFYDSTSLKKFEMFDKDGKRRVFYYKAVSYRDEKYMVECIFKELGA